MKIVTAAQMQEIDRQTMRTDYFPSALMQNAGEAATKEIVAFLRLLPESHRKQASVLTGKGNNGGDGYVIARALSEAFPQMHIHVFSTVSIHDLSDEAHYHAKALPETVGLTESIDATIPASALGHDTVIIDALLGTGITGALRSPYDELIPQINQSNLPVISVDIPSGLNGTTGEVASDCVVADLTITLGLPKAGLFSEPALDFVGILKCVDIGLNQAAVSKATPQGTAVFASDVRLLLKRRHHRTHKYDLGHVGVLAGSSCFPGAPMLSAAAALRSGAGLVTAGVPETVLPRTRPPYSALIPDGLKDDGQGVFNNATAEVLRSFLEKKNALVAGPGIGTANETQPFLHMLIHEPLPLVLDADALRLLTPEMAIETRKRPCVMTPHPGEMRFLLKQFNMECCTPEVDTLSQQASQFARNTGSVVVLKGRRTTIALPNGEILYNTSGTTALATGGTGDVLAGMIGGLLAQGFSERDSAVTGVFLHGLASELYPHGFHALIADDLLDYIGAAFTTVSPFG